MKLRYRLFLLLLLSGIVPLVISSVLIIRQNRGLLETQEKSYLTRSARFLSVELDEYLVHARTQLRQLGEAALATPAPAPGSVDARLRQPWLEPYLQGFLGRQPDFLALRLLSREGIGRQFTSTPLVPEVTAALNTAFEQASREGRPVYRLVVLPDSDLPVTVLAVPMGGEEAPELVVEGVLRVEPMETLFGEEARGDVAVFLVDRGGEILWSDGARPEVERAVAGSDLMRDFVRFPLNLTAEYSLDVDGREQRMLARISPVAESGWGVVVHKPLAAAFGAVRQMVFNTAVSSALLLIVALSLAAAVSRRVSRPIQNLARTTHEIAEGNFGKRAAVEGQWPEIAELASDFNRMGEHVQRHIESLRRAAQENREIFIGSMRAFVAAIDAKDPYTRGHSERVAAHSRTIAKYLNRDDDFQQLVWVGALLHDVGKIGVDDAVLKKGGVLTADEYEQMKQHAEIGEQIMSRIEQLKPMLPIIRWHHEAWNGKGYPDGLKGEETPLVARIVAVADTFDAITTNRPYQRAYDSAFAVETIRKLTGSRFDAKVVTAFLQAFDAGLVRVVQPSSLTVPETAVSA